VIQTGKIKRRCWGTESSDKEDIYEIKKEDRTEKKEEKTYTDRQVKVDAWE
jgi:hypothetical protein